MASSTPSGQPASSFRASPQTSRSASPATRPKSIRWSVNSSICSTPRQYYGGVRFGPWYPLAEAAAHAPAIAGVLQLRLATGLIDYPRGKSAMVWYAYEQDLRAAALALATTHEPAGLVCRHLIEIDEATDLPAFCEKLRAEFVRRFGAVPELEALRS